MLFSVSVVEALNFSGCLQLAEVCTSPLVENDQTSLAFRGPSMVSRSLWQSSKWTHQFAFGIIQYTWWLEVSACSINTNLNITKFTWKKFDSIKIWTQIDHIWSLSEVIYYKFGGDFAPKFPPGLCPGPAGGFRVPPRPSAVFAMGHVHRVCTLCVQCSLHKAPPPPTPSQKKFSVLHLSGMWSIDRFRKHYKIYIS